MTMTEINRRGDPFQPVALYQKIFAFTSGVGSLVTGISSDLNGTVDQMHFNAFSDAAMGSARIQMKDQDDQIMFDTGWKLKSVNSVIDGSPTLFAGTLSWFVDLDVTNDTNGSVIWTGYYK